MAAEAKGRAERGAEFEDVRLLEQEEGKPFSFYVEQDDHVVVVEAERGTAPLWTWFLLAAAVGVASGLGWALLVHEGFGGLPGGGLAARRVLLATASLDGWCGHHVCTPCAFVDRGVATCVVVVCSGWRRPHVQCYVGRGGGCS